MLFVLDGGVEERARSGVAELDPHAARVGPVAGVEFVGLEGQWEGVRVAGRLDGGEEVVGEGGGDGEVGGDATARGVGARGVEVEGVEGDEGFEGFFGGGGGGGAGGVGGLVWRWMRRRRTVVGGRERCCERWVGGCWRVR